MATTKESVSGHDAHLPADVAALMEEFSGEKYNKLMRKLDMRLVPIVSQPGHAHRVVSNSPLPNRLPFCTCLPILIGTSPSPPVEL